MHEVNYYPFKGTKMCFPAAFVLWTFPVEASDSLLLSLYSDYAACVNASGNLDPADEVMNRDEDDGVTSCNQILNKRYTV